MTAKTWAWALGALLVAGAAIPVAADNARRKGSGGGSSGGGSSSAGARHHGGGSSASSRSNGASRSSSAGAEQRERGSGARATPRPTTGAESRHPDPGTGHGYRGRYYGSGYPYYGYGYGYPYYGGYYSGWYGVPYYGFGVGFGYGYDPFYYGGGYYNGGYAPSYRYRESGSVRTLVEPEQTKVFVDGYYAGTVDDFDGMFQRLYIGPGRHDITFKLEGHRTLRVRVYITEDNTTKIRHKMEKGAGDEIVQDLTGGIEEPPYRMSDAYPGREREPREPREYDERPEARDGGALRLEVRPDDATIYINGEFYGSAQRARIINLPAGRHRIEVVRPGRRTVERDVEIQAGRTETLAIDLERS